MRVGVTLIALGLGLVPDLTAGLLFQGTVTASGGGFGGNTTLLTIQAQALEQGCIRWNGSSQVVGQLGCDVNVPPLAGGSNSVPGGDESSGANQTQIRTISDTGALNANQLRFVFNANEGGGANSLIRLDDLIIKFYTPDGTLIWHSGQSAVTAGFVPMTFDDPTGTGTSGQAFRLHFEDVATVQNLVFNRPDFLQVRIGAQIAATQSNSGGDNLFVTNAASVGLPEVIESSTVIYFSMGLAFFALTRFYQTRRQATP